MSRMKKTIVESIISRNFIRLSSLNRNSTSIRTNSRIIINSKRATASLENEIIKLISFTDIKRNNVIKNFMKIGVFSIVKYCFN